MKPLPFPEKSFEKIMMTITVTTKSSPKERICIIDLFSDQMKVSLGSIAPDSLLWIVFFD